MADDDISNVQKAYALLWLSPTKDEHVLSARELLLEDLPRDDRIDAVKWATVHAAEHVARNRGGVA